MPETKKLKILVAVDGTPRSMRAVKYAAGLFPSDLTEATVFHVSTKIPETIWDLERHPDDRLWTGVVGSLIDKQARGIQDFMAESRRVFQQSGFPEKALTFRSEEIDRGVARDIMAQSRRGYDAVVMGRRGTARVGNLALGSVAEKLSTGLAGLPVVLVGGEHPDRPILAAIDGSAGSAKVVSFIGTVASHHPRPVTLFHAVRRITPDSNRESRTNGLTEPEDIWIQDHLRNFSRFADQARTTLIEAGFDSERIRIQIVTGVPSRAGAILNEARSGRYGAVVVGRRGFSEVRQHPMGRVAGKVLYLAEKHAVWLVD